MKTCTTCLKELELREFCISSKGKYGVSSKCRACTHLAYVAKNPYKRRNNLPTKVCNTCSKEKDRSEFHFSNKVKGWYKPDCKQCRAIEIYNPNSNRHTPPEERSKHREEYRKNFYRLDFERNKEKYRLYVIKRRALLKKADGTFTKEEWREKLIEYDYWCAYCHKILTEETATKDHKIPLIKGGSNWITNIVPACHGCNSGKCDSIEYTPKKVSNEA